MKKYLFSLICLATFGLEAAQYSHTVTFTPQTTETGNTVYLAKIQIDKKVDENAEAVTIAAPELVCVESEATEVVVGNETDCYAVKVLVSKNEEQLKAKTEILVKEGNVDVLVSEEETVIGNS